MFNFYLYLVTLRRSVVFPVPSPFGSFGPTSPLVEIDVFLVHVSFSSGFSCTFHLLLNSRTNVSFTSEFSYKRFILFGIIVQTFHSLLNSRTNISFTSEFSYNFILFGILLHIFFISDSYIFHYRFLRVSLLNFPIYILFILTYFSFCFFTSF